MGKDVPGWRRLFGVMGPSINAAVQPDLEAMRPAGAANHHAPIRTPNAGAVSNQAFRAGIEVIGANTLGAARSVTSCEPDRPATGMRAVAFFGGAKGADRFGAQVKGASGRDVAVASHACAAALNAHGGVKRLALRCRPWTGIAQVAPQHCVTAIRRPDGEEVDAMVQAGTNLSTMRLAAMAGLWLDEPVIAINAAT